MSTMRQFVLWGIIPRTHACLSVDLSLIARLLNSGWRRVPFGKCAS